jgi:IS30 family transposase
MEQKKYHTHLSLEERRQIYFLLGRKVPVVKIARELGRHHSTIYRELQRNSYWEDEDDRKMNGYYPLSAQEYYSRRRQSLQLFARYPELKEFVIRKLKAYWSPDQIAGFLKRLGRSMFYACAETIYQFIYGAEGRELGLYRYLFKGRKRRRSLYGRKPRGLLVPEQHGIAFRPEIVDGREQIGHWEGDLMIFRRDENGTQNVTSLIERKSRYTILAKNDNRRSAPVMKTIASQLSGLPRDMTRTITFDRGFEFIHRYSELKDKLSMDTYFCDPQAPWQKGSVESNNNRIRRFLPREINLEAVSDADVYAISVILNNTPRQCLAYKTPQEVLNEHLQLPA